jgi:hypothetical protein
MMATISQLLDNQLARLVLQDFTATPPFPLESSHQLHVRLDITARVAHGMPLNTRVQRERSTVRPSATRLAIAHRARLESIATSQDHRQCKATALLDITARWGPQRQLRSMAQRATSVRLETFVRQDRLRQLLVLQAHTVTHWDWFKCQDAHRVRQDTIAAQMD